MIAHIFVRLSFKARTCELRRGKVCREGEMSASEYMEKQFVVLCGTSMSRFK